MKRILSNFLLVGILISAGLLAPAQRLPGYYDVRTFGARGDGKSLDTAAINRAIQTAAGKGGGTIYFGPGTYLSFSIRLKSNITLHLDSGATLLAADPAIHKGKYDLPEPNEWDMYQDFGHSHWKNSLMWGIGIENFAITGQGRIDGLGLSRRSPGPRRPRTAGETPSSMANNPSPLGETSDRKEMDGLGTKAIALKLSKNITLKDFSIFRGGHFALLATGVDNLTIDNLRVDTNRDGFDIDACRNVRISNVTVNTPNDDAIVLKSSYALGFPRATEHVTITNSQVSGFDLGTMLDGTFKTTQEFAPDRDRVTGRIKLGTESNGGFKNIAISNINFVRSRGLAIEMVDGGTIEDVTVTNLTMRDITTSPIFIRLGARQRAPEGTPIGSVKRILISNVTVSDAHSEFASIIAGLPGRDIEDVTLSNIIIRYKGGGTKDDAERIVPENEKSYPEPSMFGVIPAYGFYVRHARGITFDNVDVSYDKPDERSAFILDDVKDVAFYRTKARLADDASVFDLRNVTNFRAFQIAGMADVRFDRVERRRIR
ncbi:MAG: glycosyl hydrolase family 28-related protein [Pyrinomonadaceae bacterium]